MINEQYCSRETCKKIQEHIGGLYLQNAGFYASDEFDIYDLMHASEYYMDEKIPSYSQSVALRWMKDVHKRNVELCAYPHEDGCFYWAYVIFYMDEKELKYFKEKSRSGFKSKEEAAEAAINYFIDNIIEE